jgi:hypothetical protein
MLKKKASGSKRQKKTKADFGQSFTGSRAMKRNRRGKKELSSFWFH